MHQLTTRLYEEVYVELDGEPATAPAGEFAKGYDGTVEVRDVRLVSKQGIDACRRERSLVRPGAAPVVAPMTYVFVCNEPGWSLEILAGTRMVLLADYGATRLELPLPEPTVDHATRRTRWDAGEIRLEVIGRPCRDSMSGESFETEVIVHWQGSTLRGCGRALH